LAEKKFFRFNARMRGKELAKMAKNR